MRLRKLNLGGFGCVYVFLFLYLPAVLISAQLLVWFCVTEGERNPKKSDIFKSIFMICVLLLNDEI